MKAKPFLAGLLCLTLACTTVLSACGRVKAPAATPAPTESLAPTPSPAPATPKPTEEVPPVETPAATAVP